MFGYINTCGYFLTRTDPRNNEKECSTWDIWGCKRGQPDQGQGWMAKTPDRGRNMFGQMLVK